jgi:hypothetical protein
MHADSQAWFGASECGNARSYGLGKQVCQLIDTVAGLQSVLAVRPGRV